MESVYTKYMHEETLGVRGPETSRQEVKEAKKCQWQTRTISHTRRWIFSCLAGGFRRCRRVRMADGGRARLRRYPLEAGQLLPCVVYCCCMGRWTAGEHCLMTNVDHVCLFAGKVKRG